MTAAPRAGTAQLRPVTPAGILAARLADVVERIDGAAGFDPVLRTELREISALAGGLDPYLERMTSPPSAALRALAERTRCLDWSDFRAGEQAGLGLEPEMLSGHVEGQLLQMLVHAVQASRVLEIGMFTGYSALAVAEALPALGTIVACEIDSRIAAEAHAAFRASPFGDRIDVRVGPAGDTLTALAAAGEHFDLVFLDADKAGYLGYFRQVLDLGLLVPRGLLCVDNTLMQGEPWTGSQTRNGTAIAEFNDAVAADPRVAQVVVPLRDGITLIRVLDGTPAEGHERR